MLVEYKPFEPAFYHTDIADWGMALLLARAAGPASQSAGRYRPPLSGAEHRADRRLAARITDMLGGFHFNDRRYADDDLTLGSIDPYQVFRIFHEIHTFEWETGAAADIAYMIDQSHNLKGKIEAMIQTVTTAQELYAKAALVDHERLRRCSRSCALVDAEETLPGRLLPRRASRDPRVAPQPGPARRPHARLPPERLSGENHRRAQGT